MLQFFSPGWDRGRPRVTRLWPWIQPQKCAPVLQKDLWEDDQEIWGKVEVLDAWISPREVCHAQWANKASKVRFVIMDFILLICFVTIKFYKMFINIIVLIIIIIIVKIVVVFIIVIIFNIFINYAKLHLYTLYNTHQFNHLYHLSILCIIFIIFVIFRIPIISINHFYIVDYVISSLIILYHGINLFFNV